MRYSRFFSLVFLGALLAISVSHVAHASGNLVDSFTDADGTALASHTADDGSAWVQGFDTAQGTTAEIVNKAAYASGPAGSLGAIYMRNSSSMSSADAQLSFNIYGVHGLLAGYTGIVLRESLSSGAYYFLGFDSWNNQTIIQYYDGSSFHTLGTKSEHASGYQNYPVTVSANGNTLSVSFNNESSPLTVTDTHLAQAGRWGMKFGFGGNPYAPFSIDDLTYADLGNQSASSGTGSSQVASAPTMTFALSQSNITTGDTANISWNVSGATTCTASGAWSGSKDMSGSQTVSSSSAGTYTYTLSCSGSGGSTSRSLSLNVQAPSSPVPQNSISIGKRITTILSYLIPTISKGSAGTLSQGPVAAQNDNWWYVHFSNVNTWLPESLFEKTPSGSGTSSNNTGSVSTGSTSTPAVALSASPSSVPTGGSVTLSWNTTGFSSTPSCQASGGWSGAKNSSGNTAVIVQANTSFTLTCIGSNNEQDSKTVNITAIPTSSGSGGASGGGSIPGGGSSSSIAAGLSSTPPADAAKADYLPGVSVSVSPENAAVGQSVTFSWSSQNADYCRGWGVSNQWGVNDGGTIGNSGSKTLTFGTPGYYALRVRCERGVSGGTETAEVVHVQDPSQVPSSTQMASYKPYGANSVYQGDSQLYLMFAQPLDLGEFNRYSRYINNPILKGTQSIKLWLNHDGYVMPCYPGRLCENSNLPIMPRVWFTVDGQVVGSPEDGPNYDFTLDTTKYGDGSHFLGARVESMDGTRIIPIPYAVTFDNTSGPVTGAQNVANCTKLYDYQYGLAAGNPLPHNNQFYGCDWVPYDPNFVSKQSADTLTPHSATPYNTLLPASQLWVDKVTSIVPHGTAYMHRWTQLFNGDMSTAARQLYYYIDLDSLLVPQIDGPRNTASIGEAVAGYVDAQGNAIVTFSNGRIAKITPSGNVTTLVGWVLKPGPQPMWNTLNNAFDYGTAGTPFFMSHYEFVGTFTDGSTMTDLKEPWDAQPDPSDPDILYIADTDNNRIVKADLHYNPPHLTTYAGSKTGQSGYQDGPKASALLDEPWYLAIDPQGNIYFTDRGNQAIRKIDTSGNVSTVVKSSVPLSAIKAAYPSADYKNFLLPSNPQQLTDIQNQFVINGPFGTASLIYPEGLRFDSDGNLIVTENLVKDIRKVDLHNHTISFIHNALPYAYSMRNYNIDLSVDVNGTCGPKDDLLVANFDEGSFYRIHKDGTVDPLFQEDQPPYASYLQGRANRIAGMQYPWLILCGNDGALWTFGVQDGVYRITKAAASDPINDNARYKLGAQIYNTGTVPNFPERPSYELIHGIAGQDQFGGKTFDDLDSMSDAQVEQLLQNGWGSISGARPEITGKDLNALLYYVRWNSAKSLHEGNLPAPYFSTDTTPPTISNIQVSNVTATAATVTWTTSEPALGFVSYGHDKYDPPTSWNKTYLDYLVNASDIETSYTTTHSVTLTGLDPDTAYMVAVRAKDQAGNQSETGDNIPFMTKSQ